jgi:hypothetical protein
MMSLFRPNGIWLRKGSGCNRGRSILRLVSYTLDISVNRLDAGSNRSTNGNLFVRTKHLSDLYRLYSQCVSQYQGDRGGSLIFSLAREFIILLPSF